MHKGVESDGNTVQKLKQCKQSSPGMWRKDKERSATNLAHCRGEAKSESTFSAPSLYFFSFLFFGFSGSSGSDV